MIGAVDVLGSGAAIVACWPNKDALDQANQASVANDDEGFRHLVAQYGPLALPAGTRVRILTDEPFAGHIEVRVLSGDNNGVACWYPYFDESNKKGKVIAKRLSSQDATEKPAPPSPVAAQTDNAAPQITSGNTQQNAADAEIADSPLSAGNVLPLLRATSALSIRTNGATAYVTVPDTPARGTADPNRTWVGKMADGRWVGIVPLDSGGSAGIAYALMWVWTDGRAQFVGEIPADNGGLGRLSMSIESGEIHLQWPVYGNSDTKCCPSLVRTKVLTLDGIRLRPLTDTTAPAGRAP
jgi:hypothetical protein